MRLRENTGDICENSIKTIGDLILSSKNIKLKNASKIDILNIFKKPNQLKNILNCIEKEISEDSFTNFLKNTDDIMNFIKDNLEDIELALIRIIFTTSFMLKV